MYKEIKEQHYIDAGYKPNTMVGAMVQKQLIRDREILREAQHHIDTNVIRPGIETMFRVQRIANA